MVRHWLRLGGREQRARDPPQALDTRKEDPHVSCRHAGNRRCGLTLIAPRTFSLIPRTIRSSTLAEDSITGIPQPVPADIILGYQVFDHLARRPQDRQVGQASRCRGRTWTTRRGRSSSERAWFPRHPVRRKDANATFYRCEPREHLTPAATRQDQEHRVVDSGRPVKTDGPYRSRRALPRTCEVGKVIRQATVDADNPSARAITS